MNRFLLPLSMALVAIGVANSVRAEDKTTKPAEGAQAVIGVYDSRAVAYAHFWTEANQNRIKAAFQEAKAAEKQGDQTKLDDLKKTMKEGQRKIHRQVFSVAPIDDVLEEIKDRLPDIEKKAGVSVLISKWDEAKLKKHASAKQVDVTDLLVGEFKLTPKQQKVLESIKKAKPVSLDDADRCP
jgi:hypothetical protein